MPSPVAPPLPSSLREATLPHEGEGDQNIGSLFSRLNYPWPNGLFAPHRN
jgi:hypothetical protein